MQMKNLLVVVLILGVLASCGSDGPDSLTYAQLSTRYERLKTNVTGLVRTPGNAEVPAGISTYSGYLNMTTDLPTGREEFMAAIDIIIDFTPGVQDRVVVTNIVGRTVGVVDGGLQSESGVTLSLSAPGFTDLRFTAQNLGGRVRNATFGGEINGQVFGEFYGEIPTVIDGYLPSTRITVNGVDKVVVGKFLVVRE